MKHYKKAFFIITAIVLIVSLTACTVPHTYINIAGKYISDHRESFPELISTVDDGVETALGQITDDPDTLNYYMHLFGIDKEDSASAETPAVVPQQEDSKTEPVPAKPEQPKKDDKDNKKSDQKQESVTPSPVPKTEEKSEDSIKPEDTQTSESSENDKSASAPAKSSIKSQYVPEYVHYEKADFEALCEEFKQAGKENDTQKIESLYDQLVDELKLMATMNSVAFINFSVNVNEKYFDEEYNYTEKLITECTDLFMLSCREVLESDGSQAFKDHADPSIVDEAADYEALTAREKELEDQENKLENKYSTELDKIESLSIQYKGKTYTVAELYEDDSPLAMLAVFNYNDFVKVYESLLRKVNETLGPIFLDLLSIRAELAELKGYDSYADYCYENDYGRSYTTKEAAEYCDIIKKNVGPAFYQKAYYSLYNSTYFKTTFTLDKIFGILDGFTAGFDSLINDSLKELKEKELYDIGSGDGRYAGSYTTSLYSENVPFIFINSENTLSELSTLEHEFGHFVNDLYEEKDPDYFFVDGNYDIFEIHSNSMQLLCSNHYGEIVDKEEASHAQAYELAVQLSSVVEGCIYDEFQRKVYENPKMTLKQINELFGKINGEYGNNAIPGNEYMWVLVNHNFESPMYYISYSISALSAMEIWGISKSDEKKAVDTWLKVMKEADDEDYDTVMKNAGLTPFTDSKGVISVCNKVLDQF